jgi:hypothetical protein
LLLAVKDSRALYSLITAPYVMGTVVADVANIVGTVKTNKTGVLIISP